MTEKQLQDLIKLLASLPDAQTSSDSSGARTELYLKDGSSVVVGYDSDGDYFCESLLTQACS